jgi:BRCA1-associated protein
LCRPDHFCQISATFLSKFSASSFFFSKTQIISEYNELLQAQLENQKQYFEKLLQNVKEETEQKISEAASKAISQRLQKLQTRFDRCVKEKQFLEDLNENLVKNKDVWSTKITEMKERYYLSSKSRHGKLCIFASL